MQSTASSPGRLMAVEIAEQPAAWLGLLAQRGRIAA